MVASFDEMFIPIDIALQVYGLSDVYLKYSTKKRWFITLQRVLYFLMYVYILTLVAGEVILCVQLIQKRNSGEMDGEEAFLTIAELMPCIIVTIFSITKSTMMFLKQARIQEIVEELRAMWPDGSDEEITKIVTLSMDPTRQFCLVYSVVTNILSLVYNIFPLVVMLLTYLSSGETIYLMPYYIWYPYSWDTPGIFTITYLLQFYAGIYTTAIVSSVDCFFCLMVSHLCMHYQILCRKISLITEQTYKGAGTEEEQVDLNLRKSIIYHNKIITLRKEVEAIFSLVLLINLLFSSFMICMLLFSVTVSPLEKVVKYIIFLTSTITQILMISWYGNRLIEENRNVGATAYNSSWPSTHKGYKRAVRMVQLRTHRPEGISLKGFTTVSLATFSSILSASWSYFTLIRTVYQNAQ